MEGGGGGRRTGRWVKEREWGGMQKIRKECKEKREREDRRRWRKKGGTRWNEVEEEEEQEGG